MSGAKWEAQKDMVPYSQKVVLIAKTYIKTLSRNKVLGETAGFFGHIQNRFNWDGTYNVSW